MKSYIVQSVLQIIQQWNDGIFQDYEELNWIWRGQSKKIDIKEVEDPPPLIQCKSSDKVLKIWLSNCNYWGIVLSQEEKRAQCVNPWKSFSRHIQISDWFTLRAYILFLTNLWSNFDYQRIVSSQGAKKYH